MSFRNLLLMSVTLLLIFGASITSAQDNYPPLRDVADMNEFYIGAAVYTTHLNDPLHVEVLANEFNMLTPEQEAKMCELQPNRGRFDFTRFDRLMDFAEANNMLVRGHTLLWHSCTPAWIENGDFSRDEAIDILRDHIYTVVGRYKGRIPYWDVVNEAIDGTVYRDTAWLRLIGEEYVELAFQFAHEADPDAILFYNDYGAEGMNAKANRIYDMAADLLARGVPIHGVGLQAHITAGSTEPGQWLQQSNLDQNIARLGELGLQVHITELDVRFEGDATEELLQQQAADYYRFVLSCLNSPYCNTVVTWGVSDRLTWVRGVESFNAPNAVPLLFSDDYEPKPAYYAVLDALAVAAGIDPVYSDEERSELLDIDMPEPEVVEIPEPTMSDPNQLAPDSVEGIVYYAPIGVTISLDGDISDWENVPTVSMGNPEGETESITFAVAADSDFMYFMADVHDSNIVSGINEPSSGWYMEDSVEFYLNTTDDLHATSYTDGIAQIGLLAANIGNEGEPFIGGGSVQNTDVSYIALATETGYLIEASVPLLNDFWAIPAEHEAMIGFQVHVNGASAPDSPQSTKLIWSAADTDDNSWQNPSVFGRLIFWDISNS